MDNRNQFVLSAFILGLSICLGLIGAGLGMAKAVYHAKAADRYVTVKGLAEKQVDANLGIWEIDFREVGNNLLDLNTQLAHDQEKVLNFLQQQGFSPNELEVRPIKVNDQMANLYGAGPISPANNPSLQYRYTLMGGVRIVSNHVDLIQKVNQKTSELIKQGLALSFEPPDLTPNPSYFFTQLDQIRPAILSEATRSARLVAEQFAVNSGAKLGGIRRASQGLFQIMGRDMSTEDNSWQNTQAQLASIHKKVRLVTTIDYFLRK